jgi:DNA-binding transcriptional LysR family regulator
LLFNNQYHNIENIIAWEATIKVDDLNLWETFYWVAKLRSFSQAAAKLRVGAPIVSRRINHLEETLKQRLFQRSTRSVGLTDEGMALLPRVEAILQDLLALEDRVSNANELSGTIRITCLTGFGYRFLAPALAEFSKMHPEIQFEVELTDAITDLIETQMDLSIRIEKSSDSSLICRKLMPNKLVLCATQNYLKKMKPKLRNLEDLGRHQVLTLDAYRDCRFLPDGPRLAEFDSCRKIDCASGFFLTELALLDSGIAVRSYWDVAELLKQGKLLQVLPDYPLENFHDVWLVFTSRRLLAGRVRCFIEFLQEKAATWAS